jgi:hypothetical protein
MINAPRRGTVPMIADGGPNIPDTLWDGPCRRRPVLVDRTGCHFATPHPRSKGGKLTSAPDIPDLPPWDAFGSAD